MFDANMRYLSKGTKFFADVWDCEEGCVLYKQGVRRGDILLCEMLEEEHDNPLVKVTLEDSIVYVNSDDEFYETWLVFEGCQDGTSFLSDKRRDVAMKLLSK